MALPVAEIIDRAHRYAERVRKEGNNQWGLTGRVEEIQWFEGYADGSECGPAGIVAGNWNEISEYDRQSRERVPVRGAHLLERMCEAFEKAGCSIEWSDMVSMCGDCYKCVETEPSSMWWRPQFLVADGEIICAKCAQDSDYVELVIEYNRRECVGRPSDIRKTLANEGYYPVGAPGNGTCDRPSYRWPGWSDMKDADEIEKKLSEAKIEKWVYEHAAAPYGTCLVYVPRRQVKRAYNVLYGGAK